MATVICLRAILVHYVESINPETTKLLKLNVWWEVLGKTPYLSGIRATLLVKGGPPLSAVEYYQYTLLKGRYISVFKINTHVWMVLSPAR